MTGRMPHDARSGVMRHILALGGLALAVSCGGASTEREECRHRSSRYFDEAYAVQLARNGIRHTVRPGKGVCVPIEFAMQANAAALQVEEYYNSVAFLLKDSCEERALVQWATDQGLRVEVADSTDVETRQPGRMLMIRSFSAEEAARDKQRFLAGAPRNTSCKGP